MIEYFRDLTEEELLKFESFIYSPYFTSHKNNIRLYHYLRKLYPVITEEDISKENLSLHIYGEKRVNEVKIRKLTSEFFTLMEKFFIQTELENDTVRNKIILLGSLRKRGYKKRFEKNYKATSKLLKSTFSKDDNYYLNMISLINEMFYFKFGGIRGELEKGLQEKSNNLDYYFAFEKLHTFNEMIHNEGGIKNTGFFRKNYYNEILKQVEDNMEYISNHHPNLLIIYYVVKMFDTLNDKYLEGLLDYLKKKGKKFTKNKLNYYYHYITQYYIRKTNLGQIEYRKKAFELYKFMRDQKLFVIDNIITDFEFNNVVNTSLALMEYEWLEGYIEENKKYLDPEFASDAYNLAKAKLLFRKKEFKNIFTYLNSIDVRDPNYYAHSKFILAKVYYETGNINGMKYLQDNLKQYTRTKKNITSEQIETIKIFNRYISELIKVKECISSQKRFKRVILMKELDNEKKLVSDKGWFYEKLKEM